MVPGGDGQGLTVLQSWGPRQVPRLPVLGTSFLGHSEGHWLFCLPVCPQDLIGQIILSSLCGCPAWLGSIQGSIQGRIAGLWLFWALVHHCPSPPTALDHMAPKGWLCYPRPWYTLTASAQGAWFLPPSSCPPP